MLNEDYQKNWSKLLFFSVLSFFYWHFVVGGLLGDFKIL